MKYNRRLGAYRPSVRLGKHGHPMRDPNGHDVDITSDLTDDASDASLGDVPNNARHDATPATPPGTQPVHGEAQQRNRVDTTDKQPEPSLRDQLSSAFKGNDGQPAAQEDAQSAQAPALTKDGEGKYRNPDGTFASTEQVAAFEAAQQPASDTAAQSQSSAPAGLTPVEAQQFQSLPAELRQYVERTMEDLNTRATRYSEYDLIEQSILGPRREAFQAEGMTPAVALNQLFALSDFAGRDPSNFVLWFSEQRGLDLDALLDARDAATQNVDPVVAQLQSEVQRLTGTVQQFQQQGVQSAQEANLQVVQNFATEKEADGTTMKRPYLTDVMDGWTTQISAVRAANPQMPHNEVLQKAYENACWSDPVVRGKMQSASQAATQQAQQARVQAAKAAGSSVTGGPAGEPSTLPNNSNRSLRDELQSQFAAARAV
jgi:hypothetical protein